MTLSVTRGDILSRAFGYPYPRPSYSFVFPCEEHPPALSAEEEVRYLADATRTAVLSIGSNAAPSQLARKFGRSGPSIPVIAVTVADFDVVHATMLAPYASVPASVTQSPGTRLLAHLTLLDAEQMARMHETEKGGYAVVRLANDILTLRDGRTLDAGIDILAYVAHFAPLKGTDGKALAVKALGAEGRALAACSQHEAQEIVRDAAVHAGVVSEEEDLEDFVLRNAQDAERRARVAHVIGEANTELQSCAVWSVVENL